MTLYLCLQCVELNPVIIQAINNPSYIEVCKKIAQGNYRWKDLYQDFRVKLINPKNEAIILDRHRENKLDVYLYGLINNLWKDRRIVKTLNADTNGLYDINDGVLNVSEYKEEMRVTELSASEKEIRAKLLTELNNLLNSEDPKTRRQAELLKRYCEGENRLVISKQLGVNYKIIHESIEKAIIKLKSKMNNSKLPATKTEIQITLRNEGCKASYSGKEKTFYVDRMPVNFIVKEVEQAGFKITKNK